MPHSQNCKKCLQEVDEILRREATSLDPAKVAEKTNYMKSAMPLLGLSVPQQRALLKKGYSFSGLPFEEQIPIWSYIWQEAQMHEVKNQAIFFVERPPHSVDPVWLWDQLVPWVSTVQCWDQSDTLSDVCSALFERIPDHVQPCLERWCDSDNAWERRQSLVALIFYARLRERYPDPDLVFRLVGKRIKDEDYYVQKGVGWTLREAFNVWPERTLSYLHSHVIDLAPAAWQAATEKLDKGSKAGLKEKRKARGKG